MSIYNTEKTGCHLAAGSLPPSTIELHSLFNLLFRLGLPLFDNAAERHLREQLPAFREIKELPHCLIDHGVIVLQICADTELPEAAPNVDLQHAVR